MSSHEKQSENLVRANFDTTENVPRLRISLCLCLLVCSTLALPERPRVRIGFWHVSEKTEVPKISKEQLWRGRYSNYEYGYALKIPQGLVGLSPPAPWPQHGIKIRLSRNHDAHILTNADFSAADYPSLDAAVDSDLQELKKNARELQVVNRRREWLGPLEAIRVVIRYKASPSGTTFAEETTTAIRRAKRPEEAVLYTITLVTPESQYQSDSKFFHSILRSWQLRPLPK